MHFMKVGWKEYMTEGTAAINNTANLCTLFYSVGINFRWAMCHPLGSSCLTVPTPSTGISDPAAIIHDKINKVNMDDLMDYTVITSGY